MQMWQLPVSAVFVILRLDQYDFCYVNPRSKERQNWAALGVQTERGRCCCSIFHKAARGCNCSKWREREKKEGGAWNGVNFEGVEEEGRWGVRVVSRSYAAGKGSSDSLWQSWWKQNRKEAGRVASSADNVLQNVVLSQSPISDHNNASTAQHIASQSQQPTYPIMHSGQLYLTPQTT